MNLYNISVGKATTGIRVAAAIKRRLLNVGEQTFSNCLRESLTQCHCPAELKLERVFWKACNKSRFMRDFFIGGDYA